MNESGVAGLVAVTLGFSGVIGSEILAWRSEPEDAALVRPLPVVSAGAPATQAKPADRRDDRLAVILARPLFSPDRRPAAAGARSISGLPRLAGIVVTGSRKVAIFAAPPGGKPVVADEGERLGVYDVKTISEDGVTVVGPEGAMVLRPIFDPAPPPPMAKTMQPARVEAPKPTAR
ncbi:MAG: hypothetical protein ACJ8AI_28130 [Rhodopila sp.]